MKTVIIQFEAGNGVYQALCIIQRPKKKGESAELKNVTIKPAISKFSGSEFQELNFKILEAVNEVQNEFESMPPKFSGPSVPALAKSEKGILGFRGHLMRLFKSEEGRMTEAEKKQAQRAFDVVDELMGRKK